MSTPRCRPTQPAALPFVSRAVPRGNRGFLRGLADRGPAVVWAALALLALTGLLDPSTLTAQETDERSAFEQLQEIAVIEELVMMPMRDGIRLATNVYRPKSSESQPVPTIFVKTPYNMNMWRDGEHMVNRYGAILEAVRRGYAYVNQNERGRFYSEGEWDILGPPKTDGYDALTWIADQPWSNGKVGTYGCSSTAEWQMGLAALDHPAHAAMVPQGFGAGVGRIGDWYEQGNWYRGGAEQMLFFSWLYGVQNTQRPRFDRDTSREDLVRLSRYFDLAPEMPRANWPEALWHLPLEDLMRSVDGPEGIYADPAPVATGGRMIQRTPNDPAWYRGGLYHDDEPFGVPSLWFMSWYDVSIGPNLALFNHVRENGLDAETRDNQFAMVAPVGHCAYTRASENTVVGERSMGDARWDYDELLFSWWDRWLKGESNAVMDTLPRVRYYAMGTNEWRTADAWPPAAAEPTTLYLSSRRGANTSAGDGVLVRSAPPGAGMDEFTYDPFDPVLSYGGNVCCTGGAIEAGSFDQQAIEGEREDILVYTTEPFPTDTEVSGPVEVVLYVESDAKDTDITVKLLDVYPDGRAYNLDESIQRLRYRDGYEGPPVFMEPGEVYEVKVGPLTTSNVFRSGHRLRIEVSSSNFPRFTRNLNTGGNNYDETEGVVAHNRIHFGGEYPSRIRIPVVRR